MAGGKDPVRRSLWICPTGGALGRIREAMRRVRARGGGPEFEPHVTLLDGIEAAAADAGCRLETLCARLRPFTIRLGRIAWRAEYFRCLFAGVEPSAELAAARAAAEEVFGLRPSARFEPHLSLLYGELDEALKQALAAELGGELAASFRATGVRLVNASALAPVAAWRTVGERAFSGERPPGGANPRRKR